MSTIDRASRATGFAFAGFGASTATFASRIPAIKHHDGLNDGQLAMALLLAPLFCLIATQVSGRLSHRYGSGRVTKLTWVAVTLAVLVPALSSNLTTLAIGTSLVGASYGLMDPAVNAHASVIEQRVGRSVMSRFHAFFSIGAGGGSLAGSAAAFMNIAPFIHGAAVGLVLGGLIWSQRESFLSRSVEFGVDAGGMCASDTTNAGEAIASNYSAGTQDSGWSRAAVLLGLIMFFGFFGEGSAGDWSGVDLRDQLHASGGVSALGLAAFWVTMAAGRFFGDAACERFGHLRSLKAATTIAGLLFAIALFVKSIVWMIVGWAVFGFGLAMVAPITFSLAGTLPGVFRSRSIARVAGIGWSGVLAGPPVIGLLSRSIGLHSALFVPAGMCVLIRVLAWAFEGDAAKSVPAAMADVSLTRIG